MLKNHVNSCHGNHAFFILQKSLSLKTNIICISGVPMNDLAPIKNFPGVIVRYVKLVPDVIPMKILSLNDNAS